MGETAQPSAASVEVAHGAVAAHGWVERAHAHALAVDVAIACSAALVLGLIRLGTPSLWVDESFTASGNPITTFTGGYHWLYYSIEWPWTLVAGTSEWALRFPSVVGSMVACGLLVVLGHRLFGRPVALVGGLLLATSPFFVKWSQQARGYTLLVAASLVATLLLLRALERATRGAWAAYGLAFTFVIVWHPVGGLLLAPAHAVLIAQRRERARPHGLLAAVIVMALAVPWATQIALRSTGEGVAMNWLTFPTFGVATRTLLGVSGIGGLGILLAVAGLWLLHRRARSDLALWLGAWALGPFVLALLVSLVRPIYLDRYLIVAAPALALLAAVAIVGTGRRSRAVALVAVVLATSVGLVRWYATADRGNWRGEDWRSAVATVLDRRGNADIVVAPWSVSAAATYYGANVRSASTADSIWVLTWSEDHEELTSEQRRDIGLGGHRLIERLQFGSRVTAQLWKRT